MNTTTDIKRLEQEIQTVKRELLRIGPMHPGSVSPQWSVCGTATCRCHHPINPQKHGPYTKLTYVHRGKNACRFVRPEHVGELQKRLDAYKKFRELMGKWVELSIELGMAEFFSPGGTKQRRPSPPPAAT
jgi:hypothetical protein